MDDIDEAIREKLANLSHHDATLVHDATVGAMGGTITGLNRSLLPGETFTDEQLYGLVRKSIPRMLDKPGGMETLLAITAVAITRTIRAEWPT